MLKLELLPGRGAVINLIVWFRKIRYHPCFEALKKESRQSWIRVPLIGYPVLDVLVANLVGGSYDEENSTEMAFGVAAQWPAEKRHRRENQFCWNL
jgi:hypothetical protein